MNFHKHPRSKTPADVGWTDPRRFGLLKAAYSVNETLELLSIGRTSLYEAVKRGDLKLVKFGTKTLVYAGDIARFLAQLKGER
jgi:excisionase family DNA binding protein